MKNKFLILALSFGLIFSLGAFGILKYNSTNKVTPKENFTAKVDNFNNIGEACGKLTADINERPALKGCVGEYIKKAVEVKGFKATAADIEQSVQKFPEINVVCHPYAHYLGAGAWKEYKSIRKSLNFATSFCAWGYLHGLNVAASEDLKGDALLKELLDGCAYIKELKGNPFECAHGIGDAFDVSGKYDLLYAFSFCRKIPDAGMHRNCSEGASNHWMDYYMVEGVLKGVYKPEGAAKLLFKGQPYAMCLQVPDRIDRNGCLDYATHLIPGYKEGLAALEKACYQLAGLDNDGCFKGLGREYAFTPSVTLKDAVSRCLKAENYMGVRMCAGDLINAKTQVYRDRNGSILKEACSYDISLRDERMVKACKSIADALKGYFNKDYQL